MDSQAIVGGVLWALTPLRQPLLGGELPGHPVFRPYNLVLLIISVLLALSLLALHIRYKAMGGQDLGSLDALVAGVGAIPLGIALWRAKAASRVGAMLLILALAVGFAGIMLLSAVGLVNVAGLPLTILYGGAWIVLGSQLWAHGNIAIERPSHITHS